MMVFGAVGFVRSSMPQFIPLAIIIPFAVVFAHAWGQVIMSRLVGGNTEHSVLWALGSQSSLRIPVRPGPQFATAMSGIVVCLVIWLVCELSVRALIPHWQWTPEYLNGSVRGGILGSAAGFIGAALGYMAMMSFGVMLWNLIPSMFFDGGRLWRAALWPMLGLRRAVRVTIAGGFVSSAGIIVLAIMGVDMLFLVFGLMMLFATIFEHRSVQGGYDPVLETEPGYVSSRPSRPSWFGRWRERRREAREQRIEQEEAREQEILDRLLVKVSEHGLPSLTAQERDTLQAISKKQKQRVESLDRA